MARTVDRAILASFLQSARIPKRVVVNSALQSHDRGAYSRLVKQGDIRRRRYPSLWHRIRGQLYPPGPPIMLSGAVFQKVFAVAWQPWNITELFGPSLSGNASILLPTDANYTDVVTQRWTTHGAPSFMGTIQPAITDDVQNVVGNPLCQVMYICLHDIDMSSTPG
jgi:hypothetical protein